MEQVSFDFGLKINRSKTKIMIVDRLNNNSPEVTKIANCDVIQSYIYLGALISNNGGCTEEIKRRMSASVTPQILPSARISTAFNERMDIYYYSSIPINTYLHASDDNRFPSSRPPACLLNSCNKKN
ncbi:hypothetical protein K1T71_009418 [Dendrolimus kikuchii]|uniref:Uncharacterized protein n=1 Tax=Dendrolimus kikuchii TaxID=765133 RepID=A0ACC1CUM4_9NEOP|nr:hypothetical protein K1T71_009418 [Dendrolimus kikuchii]